MFNWPITLCGGCKYDAPDSQSVSRSKMPNAASAAYCPPPPGLAGAAIGFEMVRSMPLCEMPVCTTRLRRAGRWPSRVAVSTNVPPGQLRPAYAPSLSVEALVNSMPLCDVSRSNASGATAPAVVVTRPAMALDGRGVTLMVTSSALAVRRSKPLVSTGA